MHVLFPWTFLSSCAVELLIEDQTTELPFINSVTTTLLVSLLNLAILFPSHICFCTRTRLLTTNSRDRHILKVFIDNVRLVKRVLSVYIVA